MTKALQLVLTAAIGASLLTGCVSPYEAHINGLRHAYAEGRISSRQYYDELAALEAADASWHQSNANTAAAVAAVGVAAAGTAAIIAATDHDHHHHYYPHRRYYRHRGHYHY
jgi:hypothetical protein